MLAMVYVLKEVEGHLVCAERVGRMATMAELDAVGEGKLAPLQRFGRNLSKYMRGSWRVQLPDAIMSVLEGVNNKIKVIKRMAYGFRDSEYFFSENQGGLPGKPR